MKTKKEIIEERAKLLEWIKTTDDIENRRLFVAQSSILEWVLND